MKNTMDDTTGFADDWQTCEVCDGDGEIFKPRPQHDDPGFGVVIQCEACGGSGWICR